MFEAQIEIDQSSTVRAKDKRWRCCLPRNRQSYFGVPGTLRDGKTCLFAFSPGWVRQPRSIITFVSKLQGLANIIRDKFAVREPGLNLPRYKGGRAKTSIKNRWLPTKQLITDANQNKQLITHPHRLFLPFFMGNFSYFEREKRHRIVPYENAETARLVLRCKPGC